MLDTRRYNPQENVFNAYNKNYNLLGDDKNSYWYVLKRMRAARLLVTTNSLVVPIIFLLNFTLRL